MEHKWGQPAQEGPPGGKGIEILESLLMWEQRENETNIMNHNLLKARSIYI